MSGKESESSIERRLFLARLGVGAGVVGAAAVSSPAAMAQDAASSQWRPARHPQDDWYDQIPGQHRFVFDTTSPDGMSWGLRFASNYYAANQNAYGLKESDLAVVIIARHKSTTFGYNDAMWAKYGKYFAEQAEFTAPGTKEPPTTNFYMAKDSSGGPGPMDELIKKGAQFAVCGMSSRGLAGRIAKATSGQVDAVFKEMTANLVPNARIVPAGIVAVNRAQEHGYSFVYAA